MIPALLGALALAAVLAAGYYVSFWLAGGLLLGAGLIPGVILLLGDALPAKKLLGDVNYTLGALSAGGAAIIYEDRGANIYPYDQDRHAVYQDGEWRDAVHEETSDYERYRLGLAPLLVGYDATDAFGGYALDGDELPEEGETPALLDESRGGYPLYLDYDNTAKGMVVHVAKYLKSVGRDGTRLYNRTEEEALKKYGGDSQMKQMYLMLILFAAFGVMFVTTYLLLSI